MDVSPQHIEMVCAADKIQELWKPNAGDYVLCKNTDNEKVVVIIKHEPETPDEPNAPMITFEECCGLDRKSLHSWIPRFDQYQELTYNIIGLGWILFFASCTETYSQICRAYGKQLDILPEAIALMLIMDKGFGLAWNAQEKKWVKGSQIIRV